MGPSHDSRLGVGSLSSRSGWKSLSSPIPCVPNLTFIPVQTSTGHKRRSTGWPQPIASAGTACCAHRCGRGGRPNKWFTKVAPGVVHVDDGLMRLKPAWASLDMVARAGQAGAPFLAFGVDEHDLTDAGYARLYDLVAERPL